jgi:hypothetical protein
MADKDLLTRLGRSEDDFVDNLVYGKDEDGFVRHARRREFKEKYGNKHLTVWMPLWFTYINTRDDIRNPQLTTKQKVIACAFNLGTEIVLDAIRLGCIYTAYRITDYLF